MEPKKHKIGRPLRWKTPEELRDVIQEYLDNTPFEQYSVTGLALAIGASKQLINDYQKREGYGAIVREAKLVIEHSYELSMRKHGRSGDIFALKNFGWIDQHDITSGQKPLNLIVFNGRWDKKQAELKALEEKQKQEEQENVDTE